MQLSPAQFQKARAFIFSQARLLDQALFRYYFEQGAAEAVLDELTKFQNDDGGFGQALEPDSRLAASSPLATTVALQVMASLSVSVTHPLFQQAVDYLQQSFNVKKGYWQPYEKEVNDFPHAPWWTYDDETDKTAPESPANPSAEILGYLYAGLGQNLPDFSESVGEMILRFLVQNHLTIGMEGIHCYQRGLHHYPPALQKRIQPNLTAAIMRCVEPNPAAWSGYVAQPLGFVHSPDSPWYAELRERVEANLDYLIQAQADDGSWPPPWSWGGAYPDDWAVAQREWAGHLTVNTLKTLQMFGRIA